MNIFNFTSIDAKTIIETIKLIVLIPTFLFWSIYDILTKTVMVSWQRQIFAFGILYNFAYVFIDPKVINDNITGFLVCYGLTFLYSITKRLFGLGTFGGGDIMYCGLVGLLFGTAVGILTIVLSFIIFDGILELMKLIFKRLGSISVAFFPFITAALLIIVLWIGETRVEGWYNGLISLLHFKSGYINLF